MKRDLMVGAGVAGFGLLLLLVLIPYWVITPKSVQSIVLSPDFWPNIVACLIILGGLALAFAARRNASSDDEETPQSPVRLLALFILMPVYVAVIPFLGMVLASVAAFAAFLLVVQPKKRLAACITALVLPFLLYAFFYHVAGVAIPQGHLITLP